MKYKVEGAKLAFGGCLVLTALILLCQLAFLPVIFRKVDKSKHSVALKVRAFKVKEEEINRNSWIEEGFLMKWHSLDRRNVMIRCRTGRPGLQGSDGKDGSPGQTGIRGRRGEDARDQLEGLERKCIICPQGPRGPMGAPGQQGLIGEKGDRGPPGLAGHDGKDGTIGDNGETGHQGFRGRNGAPGIPGKSAAGGMGRPGPKGAPGPVGRTGLQGERGKRNYVWGTTGPLGQRGPRGLDGIPGSPGKRGNKGETGESGSNPKFCPCPLEISLLHEKKDYPLSLNPSSREEIFSKDQGLPSVPMARSINPRPPAPPIEDDHGMRRKGYPPSIQDKRPRQHDISPDPLLDQSLIRETQIVLKKRGKKEQSDDRIVFKVDLPLDKDPKHDQGKFPELIESSDLPVALSDWRIEQEREKLEVLMEENDEMEKRKSKLNMKEEGIEDDEKISQEEYFTQIPTTRSRFHYVTKRPRIYYD